MNPIQQALGRIVVGARILLPGSTDKLRAEAMRQQYGVNPVPNSRRLRDSSRDWRRKQLGGYRP